MHHRHAASPPSKIALFFMLSLSFCLSDASAQRVDLSPAEVLSGIDHRIEEHRKAEVVLELTTAGVTLPPGTKVHVEQTSHTFLFGSNLFLLGRAATEAEESAYRERFAHLFNFATLPFYWWTYERDRGQPDVSRIEAMLEWCEARDITPKGHPLAWNFADPRWLPNDIDEALSLQMRRIEDLVSAFRGRIEFWDVVNEATSFEREETLERSPILTRMIRETGRREFLRRSFQTARNAAPEAQLIINDYEVGIDYRDEVIRSLTEGSDGPLFDIVGIQSHQHRDPWSAEKIWEVCERFAVFDVPLHFTETTFLSGTSGWELEGDWPTTSEGEKLQAERVEQFYRVLFSHPSVEAITWWDFSDQGAWQGAPAGLLRADMSPKPAYQVLDRLIHQEWRTRLEAEVDPFGRIHFRGFTGEYAVRADLPDGSLTGRFPLEKDTDEALAVTLSPSP